MTTLTSIDDAARCGAVERGFADGPEGAAATWEAVSADVAAFAAAAARGDAGATLSGVGACDRAESYLAWLRFQRCAELFDTVAADLLAADENADLDLFDAQTQTAARLAMSMAISQGWAETLLAQGLALRDRLPTAAACLRDGLLTAAQARMIISRTELLDDEHCAPVDTDIAAAVRRRAGAWSVRGIRNLVDRVVFRHDPDAVREARERALANRSTWTNPGANGMATIGASMTAENARLAHAAVTALAATVCEEDPRAQAARASDAFYSLLVGEAFTCDCGRADCPAEIPVPGRISADGAGRIVVHVVADAATVAGEARHPGFLIDHGVISAEHVHAIVNRADAAVRPLGDVAAAKLSLPLHQPADPYRPSAALDAFVRIRDGYCSVSGCNRPAFDAEIDHVAEYDHDDPAVGGKTHPHWLNAKCKFHHLLKTFSTWTDDQYVDDAGHTRTTWTTPDGVTIDGPAENNEDLFAGLDRYRWHTPQAGGADGIGTTGTSGAACVPDKPTRVKSRTQRKHERRRAERARNRRMREHLAEIHAARVAGESPPLQPGDPPY